MTRHPDIFTEAEAGEYLHLVPDEALAVLDGLRRRRECMPFYVGRRMLYHRRALDAAVVILAGVVEVPRRERASPAKTKIASRLPELDNDVVGRIGPSPNEEVRTGRGRFKARRGGAVLAVDEV